MSFGHSGGKHWSSQSDAEWQTLKDTPEQSTNPRICEFKGSGRLEPNIAGGGTSASSFTNCATVNVRRGRSKALQLEPNAPGTPKLMAFLNAVRGQ